MFEFFLDSELASQDLSLEILVLINCYQLLMISTKNGVISKFCAQKDPFKKSMKFVEIHSIL